MNNFSRTLVASVVGITLSLVGYGSNDLPVISITRVSLDDAANTIVISYDVQDREDSEVEIFLKISDDNGVIFSSPGEIVGDIGFPVHVGVGKKIVMQVPKQWKGKLVHKFLVELLANDRFKIGTEEILSQVDSGRMRSRLLEIQGERSYRDAKSTLHLEKVREIIKSEFVRDELKLAVQDTMLSLNDLFMKIFNGTATGDKRKWRVVNIVGTKPGLIRGSKYVLSAHYDSAPKSPGANDNGSGVAGLLEIAQICSKYTFKNSIDFIGFDQEERDLLGSGVFVFGKNSLYNKKSVKGVVNLDMIGTYSEKAGSQKIPEGFEKLFKETSQRISLNKFKGDFAVISSNENSKALGASFVEASRGYVPALKEEHLTVAGVGDEVPQFQKSDHFVFWMDSVQSIHVGDGADTRSSTYHTPQDKMEYVNIGFSTLIAKATLATVLELAEICHCSSASFAFSSQNLQADGQKK